MRKYTLLFALATLIFISCKSDKKNESKSEVAELTILEKVANAHGIEKWNSLKELEFTFNVDRDTTHYERSWKWNTKSNDVTAMSATDTIVYNRKSVDSLTIKTDGGFINDKYWLLAPYNLVWDKDNFTFEHETEAISPISGTPMQKLTIVYGNEGGYTPGDAYDFYFGDDYIIKEWVFRKGNSPEPSTMTTWEDYMDADGLKISRMHQNKDRDFKLYFTNIKAVTQ
ncbi:hypothetical protein [Sediminicola sp. 1XM1-17]|uniref:hypothetical protein n=1 Tax=Sediminicola sp. 1XM1-17 TaxID=3127702 RepID=UPI003076F7BD